MPVTSKLPAGGSGGKLGFNNGKFTAELNIYTQMDEPKEKNGIWVKTQNKCKNILTNQKIFEDDGTWSISQPLPERAPNNGSYYTDYATQYNNKLYIALGSSLYSYDGNTFVKCISLPNSFYYITTYDGAIYMTTYGSTSVYMYIDNLTLTKIADFDTYNEEYSLFAIDNNLYAMKDTAREKTFYKYNGISEFNEMSNKISINSCIFYTIYKGAVCNGGNCIYITRHGDFVADRSCSISDTLVGIATFNNTIYMISKTEYYKMENDKMTLIGNLPFRVNYEGSYGANNLHRFKNKLFVSTDPEYNDQQFATYSATEKKFDNGTLIIQKSDDCYNVGIHKVLLSDFNSNNIQDYYMAFDDIFYYGNGGFEWDAEMYYGDGTKWIRFK